jgi:hypothetical protein
VIAAYHFMMRRVYGRLPISAREEIHLWKQFVGVSLME